MIYFLPDTPPLVIREEGELYGFSKRISAIKEADSSLGSLFKFTIHGKDWKTVSGTERFANIPVPEVNGTIKKKGLVVVYLFESGRTVSLPFTYYQGKRIVSFEPSYEIGSVCISLIGDFILNPHISYTFRILLVKNKILKRYQPINWLNFNRALQALKLEENSEC